jgi:soluble lytic murein transglycosylase-like protein
MPKQSPRTYVSCAVALLLLAAALFAAAAPQLNAAGRAAVPAAEAPPHAPSAHIPVARPAPGLPLPGSLLAAAQAGLEGGDSGPSGEVARWSVHLASNTESSEAALARYAAYRPLIQEALRKHGLPLDLAFVPWVESEWRNEATSHAGAAGIWQFMAGTARGYGLEVSVYVDERRDPVRATDAAARHLADLYRETGDWHAALASYNAGLGRARHTRGAFWRRRATLPRETRLYVPRVLAAARVGRAPVAWGLRTPTVPPLRFRELWVPGGTPLDTVAARTGAEPGAVRGLNPHLIRGMTPPGRRWPVRVPAAAQLAEPPGPGIRP